MEPDYVRYYEREPTVMTVDVSDSYWRKLVSRVSKAQKITGQYGAFTELTALEQSIIERHSELTVRLEAQQSELLQAKAELASLRREIEAED